MPTDTRFRLWPMPLIALVLVFAGCSLFKVTAPAATNLQPLLQPSEQMLEAERQADDWSVKAAQLVYQEGAPAKAPLIAEMLDVLEARRVRTGLPTSPLGAPQSATVRDRGADALIVRLSRLVASYRAAEAKWQADYDKAWGGSPPAGSLGIFARLFGWIGSLFAWLGLPAMAIAAIAGGGTVLGVLAFFIKRLIAIRAAFKDVVASVQKLLESNGDAAASKTILAAHQTDQTKAEVAKAKAALGIAKEADNEG